MLYQFLLAIGGSALLLSIWAAVIRMSGNTRDASLPAPDSCAGMASNGTMECGACGFSRKCPTTGPGPSMKEPPGSNSYLATPKKVFTPTSNQEHGP